MWLDGGLILVQRRPDATRAPAPGEPGGGQQRPHHSTPVQYSTIQSSPVQSSPIQFDPPQRTTKILDRQRTLQYSPRRTVSTRIAKHARDQLGSTMARPARRPHARPVGSGLDNWGRVLYEQSAVDRQLQAAASHSRHAPVRFRAAFPLAGLATRHAPTTVYTSATRLVAPSNRHRRRRRITHSCPG